MCVYIYIHAQEQTPTWLEKHGQAKVDALERRVLILVQEQEILRFEVPVHDTKRMAYPDNIHNRPTEFCSATLCILPLLNNPVEELSSFTELHHQMYGFLVFICALKLDDIWLSHDMMQDLNLSPHILKILFVQEFGLRDCLACKSLIRSSVDAKIGLPELATT